MVAIAVFGLGIFGTEPNFRDDYGTNSMNEFEMVALLPNDVFLLICGRERRKQRRTGVARILDGDQVELFI